MMRPTFEIFEAAIPRRHVRDWNDPIELLDRLSCVMVYDIMSFLENADIDFTMGWYGDPNIGSDEVVFRLLLEIPNPTHAMVFGLWANIQVY